MNRKAEITLGSVITIVVICLVVFVTLILPMVETNNTYNVNLNDTKYDERLTNYQVKIDTLQTNAEDFKSVSENVNGTPSALDILGFMFKSGWNAAKTSVGMTADSVTLVEDVTEDIGVPRYIYSAVITLILITIAFALVVLALGRK